MSVFHNNALIGASGQAAGGYTIERSIRLNSPDSAYLSRTPASAGNRKTWTWAGWVKRSLKNTGSGNTLVCTADSSANDGIYLTFSSDKINIGDWTTSYVWQLQTTAVYRDPAGWYHIVVAVDTTQATSSNRVKVYVNGIQETSFSTATYPSQNYDTQISQASKLHSIGRFGSFNGGYLDGYLADIHFIDGQALDPTSFGEFDTNGVWQPIEYAGTYGTNGFHLPFSDNSTAAALGTDTSGNSNTWTVNNISVAAGAGNDSLVDTPTSYGDDTGAGGEVRGNYCTLNPLDKNANCTLSNGNLDFSTGTADYGLTRATFGMSSGKWYWEITPTTGAGSANFFGCGIAKANASLATYLGDTNSWSYFSGGSKYGNGSGATAYGAQYENNDVIGVAFDADNGTLTFYRNGTSQGQAFSGLTSGPYFPAVSDGGTAGGASGITNFGQRPFAYTAPSGFKALCTTNLPEPTIADGSTAMDVVLDTGANILTAAQGAIGGSADLLWIKDRANANNHQLIDTVRSGTLTLQSNTTAAETTYSAPSGNSVAWTWDAGSSTVTNNDGSITSQVRANPSAGFSIVTYTGTGSPATVGHGLNVTPKLIICKLRSVAGQNWSTYHSSLGATQSVFLNLTNAPLVAIAQWNDTEPTSTVFTVGTSSSTNSNGNTYVAYCFAPVAGYSAFGNYTGNGLADGPFVYTGFRPRWIIIKRTDTTSNWSIIDTERLGYNVDNDALFSNGTSVENTADLADILSNGFKLRTSGSSVNASAGTYLWAAFAEHPFQTARAR